MQTCKDSESRSKCAEQLGKFLPASLFKALSDPNRIAILSSLAGADEAQTVGEIATCCPTDLSVVSRHLGTLRDAGVVEASKRGRQVFYRVRFSELATLLREIADAIEACCPPQDDGGTCCVPNPNDKESK